MLRVLLDAAPGLRSLELTGVGPLLMGTLEGALGKVGNLFVWKVWETLLLDAAPGLRSLELTGVGPLLMGTLEGALGKVCGRGPGHCHGGR